MKKLYKFGITSGWFLIIVSIFFIFSMVVYVNKLTFFDLFCTIIVIVISINYFYNNVIKAYNYIIRGDFIFIYQKKFLKCEKKLRYQVYVNDIYLDKGFFDVEKKLIFKMFNKNKILSIDYDNEIIHHMIKNSIYKEGKRKKWYILLFLIITLIIISIFYIIYKLSS